EPNTDCLSFYSIQTPFFRFREKHFVGRFNVAGGLRVIDNRAAPRNRPVSVRSWYSWVCPPFRGLLPWCCPDRKKRKRKRKIKIRNRSKGKIKSKRRKDSRGLGPTLNLSRALTPLPNLNPTLNLSPLRARRIR